jgi:hypothetical protein
MLAFVHIEKAAGTSFKFMLRQSLGFVHCDNIYPLQRRGRGILTERDVEWARRCYPWLRSIAGHAIIAPTRNLSADVMAYTMLRDPVQRTASHFQHRHVTGSESTTIDTFLARPENHNFMTRKIAGSEDLEAAKQIVRDHFLFVGLVERYDESIQAFSACAPCRIAPVRTFENRGEGSTIKKELLSDPGIYRQIEACNRLDQALYDFVHDEVFPAHLAYASRTGLPAIQDQHRSNARASLSEMYRKVIYRNAFKWRLRREQDVA